MVRTIGLGRTISRKDADRHWFCSLPLLIRPHQSAPLMASHHWWHPLYKIHPNHLMYSILHPPSVQHTSPFPIYKLEVSTYLYLTPGIIIFGVLVPRAFRKYTTCMVFRDFLKNPTNPRIWSWDIINFRPFGNFQKKIFRLFSQISFLSFWHQWINDNSFGYCHPDFLCQRTRRGRGIRYSSGWIYIYIYCW